MRTLEKPDVCCGHQLRRRLSTILLLAMWRQQRRRRRRQRQQRHVQALRRYRWVQWMHSARMPLYLAYRLRQRALCPRLCPGQGGPNSTQHHELQQRTLLHFVNYNSCAGSAKRQQRRRAPQLAWQRKPQPHPHLPLLPRLLPRPLSRLPLLLRLLPRPLPWPPLLPRLLPVRLLLPPPVAVWRQHLA